MKADIRSRLFAIVSAVAVIFVAIAAGSACQKAIIAYVMRVRKIKDVGLPLLTASYAVQYLILYVGVTIAFRIVNIDTSALLTIVTATGLTIGLALQAPLSNVASGIFMTIEQNFSIGDTLQINLNGFTNIGKVIGFDLLQTVLYNAQTGSTIIIPNRVLHDNIFTKYS